MSSMPNVLAGIALLMLPAVPVIAGVAKAPLLARWGASLLLAGFFTATMMLVLQLSISFG